ncbi:OLC1v1035644C1 [Oldenlandia corymbosa var. corymbosa]|uniref:OLC1v1035644C1 n=1 Tax=Oldenlandia corymbosa var. corymbosa TaxID=529605 RepID=A0AAV1CWM4_OLDCO|nr:OLC1v1035644C1 [Oldenlandia corymbosa var. corymbosa]
MIRGTTLLHAPTLRLRNLTTTTTHSTVAKPGGSPYAAMASPPSVRIAVVGDVHDDWSLEEDTKALQLLKPDLVLFTGDFGNENVELVRSVADVDIAKAVILGNHDAWSTQKFSASEKDPVQLQLECLGDEHVGYGHIDFPAVKLTVVGGRPFSHGGPRLHQRRLLKARYNVSGMDESAKRIYQVALKTPEEHSVILLAHNGPTGLGSDANDICGKDWVYGAGDYGDPDLAAAISQLKETTNLSIPLVVFGHMHKRLADGIGLRKMIVVGDNDTVYLNGAIVPRVKRQGMEQEMGESSGSSIRDADTVVTAASSESAGTLRAFTVAEMLNGRVEKVAETWVSVNGENITLQEEHILFSRVNSGHSQSLHRSLF